jgi:hypothetical protein
MNCPQIYSIGLCVKHHFSKLFSRVKNRKSMEESVEVWKTGSMEVWKCPPIRVERWDLTLALALSLSLVIL